MKRLILTDGTRYEVSDDFNLRNASVMLNSLKEISAMFEHFTEENMMIVQVAIVEEAGEDVIQEFADVILDEAKFEVHIGSGNPEVKFSLREKTMEEKRMKKALDAVMYLPDKEATSCRELYPEFNDLVGNTVEIGTKFNYMDGLYKTIQDNLLIQKHYPPLQGTESLYTRLDESHAGTKEDPILWAVNMRPQEGKYYTDGKILVECIEDPGRSLYHELRDLCTGRYFMQTV